MNEPNLLDLVFTNEENMIDSLTTWAPLGHSDHVGITFKFATQVTKEPREQHNRRRNYWKADFPKMRENLKDIDWESLLENKQDVEEVWQLIKNTIEQMVINFVPFSGERHKSNKQPWMCSSIRRSSKRKQDAWKRYVRTGREVEHAEYVKLRNEVTKQVRQAKMEHERSLIRRFKNKPKLFYKHVRQQQKVKLTVTQVTKEDGTKTSNDYETAQEMSKFFKSVFVKENNDPLPDFNPQRTGYLGRITVSPTLVEKKMLKLKEDKAMGPDNIHPKLLVECAKELSYPIYRLFVFSLNSGTLPQDWKNARVSPIHKKGKRDLVNNYRPVSLTSVICKLLESIVRDEMLKFFEDNEIMNKDQHSLTKSKSCLTNLLETLEDWTKALDEGYGVDAVYLDYKKAFDTVPHRRLIHKLHGYGISGSLLDWISNFLYGREMQVCIGSSYSEKMEVISGVPQGSVIGPLLFLSYVIDFNKDVSSHVKMFADDSKVYRYIKSHEDCGNLQEDLNKLSQWSKSWLLSFNIDKCKRMHIGRGNPHYEYSMYDDQRKELVPLEETTKEKDLGVWITDDLKPSYQCSKAAEKGMRALRMIRRSFEVFDKESFLILYKTYVRTHLEYAVQSWNPYLKKDITVIENIQRRATKLVQGFRNLSYEERLERLGLTTLEKRRLRGDLIETFKILYEFDKVDKGLFQRATTQHLRGHSLKLFKHQTRLQVRSNFFSQRIINIWNNLPEHVVTATSVNSFKNKLDKHWAQYQDLDDSPAN